jgi:glutamine synthetase
MTFRTDEQVLAEVREDAASKVKVAVTDIDGVLRGKYLHRDKFLSAAESSFGFCNVVFGGDSGDVCYDNATYTGWQSGYPDVQVKLDLKTFRRVPWDGGVPFFLGDFVDGVGAPLEICPRQLLKRVIARANDLGFTPKCGLEFEWFNFKETPQSFAAKGHADPEPLTPGMFGYSLLRAGLNRDFFNAMFDELGAFGVPIEGLHTETGPGVLEAAIVFGDALECADRGVLFKTSVKEIAYRFGILPTFMAKPSANLPGCSGHLHLSLWDENGENRFFDGGDPCRMSSTFRSFLAGQLLLLPEILPFFAPNVNSYKRLVDGYWAPTRPTWGIDNRTAALRVIPGSAKSTRVEVRLPGADTNPYLTVAAAIAAGLYGVERGLDLTSAPVQGSAYARDDIPRFPRNLADATARLGDSKVARDLFGEVFVDHFVRTRTWEWRQFQDAVTSWELKRYFEII